MLEIIPFAPNRFISPNPWDIEGINIGSVKSTFNTALCSIFVLLSVYANKYAIIIDIIVEIDVTNIELLKDSLKAFDAINLLKFDHSTFNNITIKG